MSYIAVGRYEVVSENHIPVLNASREITVKTLLECSLKCTAWKSYTLALVPDGPTSYSCLLYDSYDIQTDLRASADSLYVAAMMYVNLLHVGETDTIF